MMPDPIIAVDPGTLQSAYVIYVSGLEPRDMEFGIAPNRDMERRLHELTGELAAAHAILVLEMIECFGMPIGASTLETAVWIGRFVAAWGGRYALIGRRDVKLTLCKSPAARDSNVRQALLDRYGAPGTRKAPGPTYGYRRDMWSALGLATAYADMYADAFASGTGQAPGRLLAADMDAQER